jgi:hypothetical protein
MLSNNLRSGTKMLLLAGIVASSITASPLRAQSAAPAGKPMGAEAQLRDQPSRFSGRRGLYYQLIWGIDAPGVKLVESGELVRFSYTVLDSGKASPLHDKKLEPALIDERARVRLVIPALENVGQLRQTGTPEAGKSYWMLFSNKGNVVKPGDRVSVVIGKFRMDGLIVQ